MPPTGGRVRDNGAIGGAVAPPLWDIEDAGAAVPPHQVGWIEDHGATGGTGVTEPHGAWLSSGVVQVWFTFGSGLARLGLLAVQIRIRFGSFRFGSAGSEGQMQFRCGSGLARLGTAAVQIRCRICTDLVQIQFMTGSESLQILFCWAQRQSRFGSELDQVWLGWAQLRFRIGSQFDQYWFIFGSYMV